MKEKEERHNKAGAAWQELETKIQAFLATTPTRSLSPNDIKHVIDGFAEARRKVCEIACPEQSMYLDITNNPNLCAQRIHDRNKGYRQYKKQLHRLSLRCE